MSTCDPTSTSTLITTDATKSTNTFCILEVIPRQFTHLNLWTASRTIHSACVHRANTPINVHLVTATANAGYTFETRLSSPES